MEWEAAITDEVIKVVNIFLFFTEINFISRVTLDCQKLKQYSKSIFLEEQVVATQLWLDGRKFSRGRNLLRHYSNGWGRL